MFAYDILESNFGTAEILLNACYACPCTAYEVRSSILGRTRKLIIIQARTTNLPSSLLCLRLKYVWTESILLLDRMIFGQLVMSYDNNAPSEYRILLY